MSLNPDGTHDYWQKLTYGSTGVFPDFESQLALTGVGMAGGKAITALGSTIRSLSASFFGRQAANETAEQGAGLLTEGLAYEFSYAPKHIPGTPQAAREASRGSAHVFNDLSTLTRVEAEIISSGKYTGTFGGFSRYGLRFDQPIGMRIGRDGTTTALHYGEMKLRANGLYHIIPRTGPRK